MSDKKKYTKFVLDMEFDPESRDVTIDAVGVDSLKKIDKQLGELKASDAFDKMIERLSEREGKRLKRVRTFDNIRGDQ